MRREEQESDSLAATRGSCCSSRRKVGSWNRCRRARAKCQELHPGSPHSNPWRCGSPPAEGNAGKIAWERSGVIPRNRDTADICLGAHAAAHAAGSERCRSAEPSPPHAFPVLASSQSEKNTPAASQVWDPAPYQWDKRNPDCSRVLEHCHEAREIRMLRDLPRATDDPSITSRC